MRPRSLSSRLILSSAAVSIVLLVLAAILLATLFQQALERNFDARLQAVMDGLLANVDPAPDGMPLLDSELADTRFSLPLSGWYWQVQVDDGKNLPGLASASLLEQRLNPDGGLLARRRPDGVASFFMTDVNGTQLRVIQQNFKLGDNERNYSFLVAGNFDELKGEIDAFRHTLFVVLGLLGIGLMVAVLLQVNYGLLPLKRLRAGVTAIREGRAEKLEGEFPAEIRPVADELNLLIKSNADIIERARTQVGNLAHALKTPLSVLTNEAHVHKSPFASKVVEQTNVMRDHVSLYLDRARRAVRAQGLGAVTEIKLVLEAIARTTERIHRDKGVTVKVKCKGAYKFRGEKQDFEEMMGNLIDNACKWAVKRVVVKASLGGAAAHQGRTWLTLLVDDDGPGLPAERRADALKRGQRLDETKPGSGLGLSIVKETAQMYGGSIELDDAELGGLRVRLILPAAA
ncbi:MAG: ATP-binding protein [Alphaproteobacteria bacterium]|nr:ATP-binding protein [Alphaproteobacteria bacterium]